MYPELKAFLQGLTEAQVHTDRAVSELAAVMTGYVADANTRMTRIEANLGRLENNLEDLVRAIASEHSNGRH